MADNFTFSSNTETYGYTDVPSGWLNCERKSTIIAGKYLKIISLIIIIMIYL